jgi:hypothetical protein
MNRRSRLSRPSPVQDKRSSSPVRAALQCGLIALAATACQVALAQSSWLWIDDQQRKVYSDTPPPPSIPEPRILLRPAPVKSQPTQAQEAASAAANDASPPKSSVPPRNQAGRKGEVSIPLYQRNEEALRENCRRARSALQTLNSGLKLMTLNDKGEQVEMDAATREREIQQMRQDERDNCVPERKLDQRR